MCDMPTPPAAAPQLRWRSSKKKGGGRQEQKRRLYRQPPQQTPPLRRRPSGRRRCIPPAGLRSFSRLNTRPAARSGVRRVGD
jgi:hypothetical protein